MSRLNDAADRLRHLTEAFLRAELSFADYSSAFSEIYLAEDDPVGSKAMERFDQIYEKMDTWVGENPDAESRSYGWIGVDEFKEWLKAYLDLAESSDSART